MLAQENDRVGLETRQEIEAVLKMREEAINKNDAAKVAALYTQDATSIRSWESDGGLASGRQAIVLRSSTCTGDDSHFFFADDDNWFGMMLSGSGVAGFNLISYQPNSVPRSGQFEDRCLWKRSRRCAGSHFPSTFRE